MVDVIMQVEPTNLVLTPYAMARMSHHYFGMASAYDDEAHRDSFLPRLYVLCVSIEVGLKAGILAHDCTAAAKDSLRKIGHSPTAALDRAEALHAMSILSPEERAELGSIEPFFKRKDLEYFSGPMIHAAATGFQDVPNVAKIQAAAQSVNAWLGQHDFFSNADVCSDSPGRSTFTIV